MRKIFVQIGYPKCFSTTLQRSYFEVHPDVTFGGVGVENNISYANRDIEFIFESLLKYATSSFFEKELINAQKILRTLIENAPAKNAIVFSSEYLVYPITLQQIDFQVCLNRIQKLFEDYEIQVLMVLRGQDSLLKSLYGEYIKMGYPETYSEFIKWTWAYQDRNFWEVLNYYEVFQFLHQKFGKNKVHIEFFENWKKDPEKQINENISKILEVPNLSLPIKNDNPSLDLKQQANLLYQNRQAPRGMGKHVLFPFENHRNREIMARIGASYTNDEVFESVHAKRLAYAKINQTPQQSFEKFYELSNISEGIYKKMQVEWAKSNRKLEGKWGKLPYDFFSL